MSWWKRVFWNFQFYSNNENWIELNWYESFFTIEKLILKVGIRNMEWKPKSINIDEQLFFFTGKRIFVISLFVVALSVLSYLIPSFSNVLKYVPC